MTFPSHEFEKGHQCTFHPRKLYCFVEKKKPSEILGFHKGTLTSWDKSLPHQKQVLKVKHYFGGFWASERHESFLNMINYSWQMLQI